MADELAEAQRLLALAQEQRDPVAVDFFRS
jgi:hypothetical protein